MKLLSIKDLEGVYTIDLACEFVKGSRLDRRLQVVTEIKSDGSTSLDSYRIKACGQSYKVDNLQEAVDIYNGKIPE